MDGERILAVNPTISSVVSSNQLLCVGWYPMHWSYVVDSLSDATMQQKVVTFLYTRKKLHKPWGCKMMQVVFNAEVSGFEIQRTLPYFL
jgi:hypothetical protein